MPSSDPYTEVAISNMALGHIGTSGIIENLQSDRSAEAISIRTYYQTAVRSVLRAFNWSFAKVDGELALDQNLDRAKYQWAYRYQRPSDAIRFIKVLGDERNETDDTAVPFDPRGKFILTDREDAIGVWISDKVTEGDFDDDFAMAVSYRLALLICPSVIRGKDTSKKAELAQLYSMSIEQAMASSANEPRPDKSPPSEFERARV